MNRDSLDREGDIGVQGGGIQTEVAQVYIELVYSGWLIQSTNGGRETTGVREHTKTLLVVIGNDNVTFPIKREETHVLK
jgi:hypothetical protein